MSEEISKYKRCIKLWCDYYNEYHSLEPNKHPRFDEPLAIWLLKRFVKDKNLEHRLEHYEIYDFEDNTELKTTTSLTLNASLPFGENQKDCHHIYIMHVLPDIIKIYKLNKEHVNQINEKVRSGKLSFSIRPFVSEDELIVKIDPKRLEKLPL